MSGVGEDPQVLGCATPTFPYYLVGAVATSPDSSSEQGVMVAGAVSGVLIVIIGLYLNTRPFKEDPPPPLKGTFFRSGYAAGWK